MSSPNQAKPVALKCPQCGASVPPGAQGYTVCQYCGSSLVCGSREGQAGAMEQAAVRGMRLKMFTYTDREATGLEVFRMLVPVGWQFQGGCRWLLDNPGMPATVACQLWNPQGPEAFEILPNMNLVWNNNPMTRMMNPVGSRYFGAEVRPPMGIQEAMRGLVLPRYRSQVQNLQVLSFEPLPDFPRLAKSEAAISGGSAEGGKVRIRYGWQGGQFDEEIYGMVEIFRAPVATMFSAGEIIVWFVDALFSFRAAAGRLDASADLFSLMIRSFKLNPQWYAAFKSIAQYLAQMQIQRIHHIGQIGSILAQTGSEMREQNLRDWYGRQEVYDRLSTDWSRTIRDVDGFFDPHRQEVVELPSGYGHAWANNLGEYILTEDPNFDPNVQSNLHWEPMQPPPQ
jgi:hypothetical protein